MKRFWIPILMGCAVLNGSAIQEPKAALFEEAKTSASESPIDIIVFRALSQKGIRPSYCSDAVFLRRAYLDVINRITLKLPSDSRALDAVRALGSV